VKAPAVAVVGRQNVGKSTLVNRMFGSREAIAHEMPGVTRDRVELEATWGGRTLKLIDTGGFAHDAKGIEALVSDQAERAARDADVVLLVVDVQTGPLEEDAALARRLRRAHVPVLVVVNKVDSERDESDVPAFLSLGLGDPVPVSALHGRGSGDLLDQLVAVLPDEEAADQEPEEPRFAIVGRPNVGKSSLFNRLVGEERSVVYEEAGTTRDAVDALVSWPDGPVRFVDTAGFRRPSRVQGVEYYSFLRAERAIERADVALLVLDASDGFTGEDKRIAARVTEVGRGLVAVANKWDLIEERDRSFKELTEMLSPYARAPVLRTSAMRGTGVHRLPAVLSEVHERWNSRAPTARVNEVVAAAQAEQQAPGGIRYRYATQVAAGPPRFVLFGAGPPAASYQRFLEGRLRRALHLEGVPIGIRFRPGRRAR
jgi:GTP-binding protein